MPISYNRSNLAEGVSARDAQKALGLLDFLQTIALVPP